MGAFIGRRGKQRPPTNYVSRADISLPLPPSLSFFPFLRSAAPALYGTLSVSSRSLAAALLGTLSVAEPFTRCRSPRDFGCPEPVSRTWFPGTSRFRSRSLAAALPGTLGVPSRSLAPPPAAFPAPTLSFFPFLRPVSPALPELQCFTGRPLAAALPGTSLALQFPSHL